MIKNYLEKAKDILYDLSDYIIIFSIMGIRFIIGWRLDILFTKTTAMIDPAIMLQSEKTESKLVEKPLGEFQDNISIENGKTNIIKVLIPNGTPSTNIGNILLDIGLITSTKDFEDKVTELDLEKSLRFAEFDIEKDSSLELIVKIIANQK